MQETWFDVVKFFELIDKYKCTDMASVPTMIAMMIAHPDIDKYDLTSLSVVNCGAAPVPREVADAFMERTGSRIRAIFILTKADIRPSGRVLNTYDVKIEIENSVKPALTATWMTMSILERD